MSHWVYVSPDPRVHPILVVVSPLNSIVNILLCYCELVLTVDSNEKQLLYGKSLTLPLLSIFLLCVSLSPVDSRDQAQDS